MMSIECRECVIYFVTIKFDQALEEVENQESKRCLRAMGTELKESHWESVSPIEFIVQWVGAVFPKIKPKFAPGTDCIEATITD